MTDIQHTLPKFPTADWEKTKAVVVNPHIWSHYRRPRYDYFHEYQELFACFATLGVDVHELTAADNPLDIWIRDWGPVEGWLFNYKPPYAAGYYSPKAIRLARNHLPAGSCLPGNFSSLVIEGGNFVHNGHTVVATDKFLHENDAQINGLGHISSVLNDMGFKKVCTIPNEPEPALTLQPAFSIGHSDGICRFLDENTLLVNDYSDQSDEYRAYQRTLIDGFQEAMPHVKVELFPWYSTGATYDGIWSAEGYYINFVHTAQGIIMPTFGHDNMDHKALARLKELAQDKKILTCPASKLSRSGGVLNCIVNTY